MREHKAIDVAKWFILYNDMVVTDNGGDLISNLKLQKLLYYAQGCFLAVKGRRLFADPLVAWQHGPVVADVYHYYKSNGANGIQFDESDTIDMSEFDDEENELLKQVYEVFGQYSAWKLRNMTHQETPWKETKNGEVISTEIIKEYFLKEYVA